jgi:hypothetical protein
VCIQTTHRCIVDRCFQLQQRPGIFSTCTPKASGETRLEPCGSFHPIEWRSSPEVKPRRSKSVSMKINTDLNHLGFTKKTGTKNIFELIYTKS